MSTTESNPMTYEEYLQGEKKKSEESIINSYNETVGKINTDYDETINDIDTSYKKNLAGYGKNAELLASMGLANSGYSDYLNSQAVAQQGASMRSAASSKSAALSAAATAKSNALSTLDTSYNTNLLTHRTENFNNLYADALKGMYSEYDEEAITSLISDNHLTSDQANRFRGAINHYNTQKAETDKLTAFEDQKALASSGYYASYADDAAITEALKDYNFSTGQIAIILQSNNLYKEDRNNKILTSFYETVYYDVASVEDMLKNSGVTEGSDLWNLIISEQQGYNAAEIVQNIQNAIAKGESIISYAELDQLVTAEEITDAQRNEIVNAYGIKENGYRPDNVNGEKVKDSGVKAKNGQTIWKTESGDKLYIWSDVKNAYVEYGPNTKNVGIDATDPVAKVEFNEKTGFGSFNDVGYRIQGLNPPTWSLATDAFKLTIGTQTFELAKGLDVDSKLANELEYYCGGGTQQRGTIVVYNGEIYMRDIYNSRNNVIVWTAVRASEEQKAAILAAFAGIDTSYAANTGGAG